MIKVKALIPFAGEVTMAVGDIKDIPDDLAKSLIGAKYVKAIKNEPKKAKVEKEKED